jgi:translocation and assembly module TamB
LEGGDLLIKKIGDTLGLDVRVESRGSFQQATLFVGRYLSPQFYISYGIGLFDAANTVRLRYQISRTLALRATSGEQSAIDVLYVKEY